MVIVRQSQWTLGVAWVRVSCVVHPYSMEPLCRYLEPTVLFLYHLCQSVYLLMCKKKCKRRKNKHQYNEYKRMAVRWKMTEIVAIVMGAENWLNLPEIINRHTHTTHSLPTMTVQSKKEFNNIAFIRLFYDMFCYCYLSLLCIQWSLAVDDRERCELELIH